MGSSGDIPTFHLCDLAHNLSLVPPTTSFQRLTMTSNDSLNRYSMPVTRSRTGLYDVGLDQTNTTRFLFGDEEPSALGHVSAPDENFPTLVRRDDQIVSYFHARPTSVEPLRSLPWLLHLLLFCSSPRRGEGLHIFCGAPPRSQSQQITLRENPPRLFSRSLVLSPPPSSCKPFTSLISVWT